VLLQQLGEPVPTHFHPNVQHWDLQQLGLQLREPQAATEQGSDVLQEPEQLQQPQQPAKQQEVQQQLSCAELQLRVEHDTAQMQQQSKQLQQGLVLQGVPQALCMQQQQQQQQQRLLNSLLQVLQSVFLHSVSMVRVGRGHLVSQLCMTNLQTRKLMKEVDLNHFRVRIHL
jgi:hypothetical protein